MTAIVNMHVNLAGEMMIAKILTMARSKKRDPMPKNMRARILFDSSGSKAIVLPSKVVGFGFGAGSAFLNMDTSLFTLPLLEDLVLLS